MRTVGQVLKESRTNKLYTLEQAEKATKIRKELIEALENDDYQKLPPPTFVQGFIKNYGKFLGLNEEKLLAIYRREFSDKRNPSKMSQSWTNSSELKKFHLTPARIISSVIFSLVIIFFVYLWVEYRFLSGAPFLEISSPTDQSSVQSPVVKVLGKTDSEAKVMINNQSVEVDFAGNFSQEIKLSDSANVIEVSSTSKYGKVTKESRTVFLKR